MTDTTVKDAEDTGLSDAADTSTNEDTDADYDSDDIFDDIDVSDVQPEAPEDDEAATESTDDDTEESDDDVADDSQAPEDEANKDEDSQQDTSTTSDEERKRHNDEMAKARIEARKAREEAEAIRKAAEDSRIEQYLKEAEGDDAELRSREQDVREYRLQQKEIETNENFLLAEVKRATTDFSDLFNSDIPEVQAEMLAALDDFEERYVVKKNDRPLEIKGDLYKHLERKATSIRNLTKIREQREQQQKAAQKSRTMTPPVKAPKKEKSDPGIDAFDEEANKW